MRALDTSTLGHAASTSAHSPLQHLVEETDLHRSAAQRSYQKSRHDPRTAESRDAHDTLERLIGSSFEKVGGSLLLSSRARQSYEEPWEAPLNADDRPLTSAGKKGRKASRGERVLLIDGELKW